MDLSPQFPGTALVNREGIASELHLAEIDISDTTGSQDQEAFDRKTVFNRRTQTRISLARTVGFLRETLKRSWLDDLMKPREKTFMKIMLACVLISWGPGYAVANNPAFLGPVPLPYAWTVFWFLVFWELSSMRSDISGLTKSKVCLFSPSSSVPTLECF